MPDYFDVCRFVVKTLQTVLNWNDICEGDRASVVLQISSHFYLDLNKRSLDLIIVILLLTVRMVVFMYTCILKGDSWALEHTF